MDFLQTSFTLLIQECFVVAILKKTMAGRQERERGRKRQRFPRRTFIEALFHPVRRRRRANIRYDIPIGDWAIDRRIFLTVAAATTAAAALGTFFAHRRTPESQQSEAPPYPLLQPMDFHTQEEALFANGQTVSLDMGKETLYPGPNFATIQFTQESSGQIQPTKETSVVNGAITFLLLPEHATTLQDPQRIYGFCDRNSQLGALLEGQHNASIQRLTGKVVKIDSVVYSDGTSPPNEGFFAFLATNAY